ncbi:hypothetical protein E0H22_05015 [Rhodopseudomonas boonkerdii]|uniref:hypothetical protein n=1 Tax=Rhodopseudomonas boonkerdii TaxID=475937 RepID=UPI001E4EC336|nr:hypothetical protein [Rhodopseudomonas boonkerdii]UGV25088.1 hypothetical protein E0H22_05015 [Rhodopseudomonas boonkerdii]
MTGNNAARIWQWPLVLAALTCLGLASALLGEGGVWWGLSWIALAIPLVVIVIAIHRRRRAPRPV